jgi:short-chain fatty acids transporter
MFERFLAHYIRWVRKLLPSPLTIALVLSGITCLIAWLFNGNGRAHLGDLTQWWVDGLWQPSLMVFALQMMLMLVLGHALALSPWIAQVINYVVKPCTNTSRAAAIVGFTTILVGLFNWGLGLIFGAILARKVGEKARNEQFPINYALIGAAGYTGLMVWHGGLSGSSLIKVAEMGHIADLMGNQIGFDLPPSIPLTETVFSSLNISVTILLVILIPATLYFLGKTGTPSIPNLTPHVTQPSSPDALIGAERLDHSHWFSRIIGILLLAIALFHMVTRTGILNYFTPNNINFLLLALAVLSHQSIHHFTSAVEEAIRGASGILIQFPLYFGILALMKESGVVQLLSEWFVSISSPNSYPILTFISAGLVNIFVPSGGGQWAIQGPIIVQSAHELGISLPKSILAMAYGDEITNMLQPFWALPLLGITRLSAKDILPYTLALFLVGSLIFSAALYLL